MNNSDHQNQQSTYTQYHQNVVIVGKNKSAGVAFILTFFFGPLGLLYASVTGGIVMFILGVIISIVTLGLGLIVVWITCIIWAMVAVNNANSKISSAIGVNANMGTITPQPVSQAPQPQITEPAAQQPVVQVPPQQVIEQTPAAQPVINQPVPNFDSKPQNAQMKQQEANVSNVNNNLSLNNFSDWVINNKKGLIFGFGGIVIILVLVVAVKFVVSVNFGKQKPEIISSTNVGKADSTVLEGDANAPIPVDASNNVSSPSTTAAGLFPQGSIRILMSNDLSTYSRRDLQIMRNEIFARHGYIFKTADMKSYFAQQNWYKPLYNDVTNQLTDVEKKNVELIKSYER